MADCHLCGGSNRTVYMPCPRCGLFDPTEMAQMLSVVQAGGGTTAEQTAVTNEQNNYPDQPGTT